VQRRADRSHPAQRRPDCHHKQVPQHSGFMPRMWFGLGLLPDPLRAPSGTRSCQLFDVISRGVRRGPWNRGFARVTGCVGVAMEATPRGRCSNGSPRRAEAGGRTVRASPEEPQYLVRSSKSGGEAVHKPDALEKM
jgi:Hypervirulence associated proteins TUDOR domain